ncbi:hypothetical protein TPAR_07530, partial [Tolypocladium paradoxum]
HLPEPRAGLVPRRQRLAERPPRPGVDGRHVLDEVVRPGEHLRRAVPLVSDAAPGTECTHAETYPFAPGRRTDANGRPPPHAVKQRQQPQHAPQAVQYRRRRHAQHPQQHHVRRAPHDEQRRHRRHGQHRRPRHHVEAPAPLGPQRPVEALPLDQPPRPHRELEVRRPAPDGRHHGKRDPALDVAPVRHAVVERNGHHAAVHHDEQREEEEPPAPPAVVPRVCARPERVREAAAGVGRGAPVVPCVVGGAAVAIVLGRRAVPRPGAVVALADAAPSTRTARPGRGRLREAPTADLGHGLSQQSALVVGSISPPPYPSRPSRSYAAMSLVVLFRRRGEERPGPSRSGEADTVRAATRSKSCHDVARSAGATSFSPSAPAHPPAGAARRD